MSVEKDHEDKSPNDSNETNLKEESEEPEDFSALYEEYSAGIRGQLQVEIKLEEKLLPSAMILFSSTPERKSMAL